MKTDNHALKQAEAQMESVRDLVAALDVDYERLEELQKERAELTRVPMLRALRAWEAENAEELETLEAAADGCSDREDAEQRIHEDALSVDVRSDWHAPGDEEGSAPSEFRILLCTGGPAVQIRGELNHYGEPARAWLEYQDWFTPWTKRINQPGDQEALLAYAGCFYFGQ